MKPNEIDRHLNDLSFMIARHQGLQFNNQKEAENHVTNTTAQLKDMMQQSNAMFIEGLNFLIETNHQPVATISAQILDSLNTPEKMVQIIEAQIINNDDSLKLFSESVNSYYGCGDFHTEECVISVLLTLFPMEPQPFACYATMLWRKEGIGAAVELYKNIVDVFKNPILDYFAADCYFKAGDRSEAKALLDRAMQGVEKEPETYADIAQFIRILSREL